MKDWYQLPIMQSINMKQKIFWLDLVVYSLWMLITLAN